MDLAKVVQGDRLASPVSACSPQEKRFPQGVASPGKVAESEPGNAYIVEDPSFATPASVLTTGVERRAVAFERLLELAGTAMDRGDVVPDRRGLHQVVQALVNREGLVEVLEGSVGLPQLVVDTAEVVEQYAFPGDVTDLTKERESLTVGLEGARRLLPDLEQPEVVEGIGLAVLVPELSPQREALMTDLLGALTLAEP